MFNNSTFPLSPLDVGEWSMSLTQTSMTLDPAVNEQFLDWIEEWAKLPMHDEATWVQREFGVPSLLVRYDATVDGQPYELDGRPQGAGITAHFNPFFAERFANVKATWPDIVAVQTPKHAEYFCDDHFWLKRFPLGQEPEGVLKLVRNMPWDYAANHLTADAVAPVANEGAKAYGEHFGWWHKVTAAEVGELDWDKSFVLKPINGAKGHDIIIWVAGSTNKRPRGAVTKTKVKDTLLAQGEMWLQKFHAPHVVETEHGSRNLMVRPYYGFNIETRKWESLGGQAVLGDTLKIHGSSATIFARLEV